MELLYIQQILNGEPSKFAYFVETYKDMAFSIAFRVLNNYEDAEEVVQDSFVKAFKALNKFQNNAKFSTWFYKIVFNTSISKTRYNKARKDTVTQELSEELIQITESVYETLTQAEQVKFINIALEGLKPEDSLLLTLYYLNDNTMEEISEITGIPKDTLKMQIYRARKKMYARLNSILKTETKSIL